MSLKPPIRVTIGVAAHKRERKQAAVKVEFGFHVPRETDSRWDWGSRVRLACVTGYVGTGLWVYVGTLPSVYVGIGLRWHRFTLEAWDVGPRLRVYVGRVGRV